MTITSTLRIECDQYATVYPGQQ